jgi:hypothetical protein
MRYLVIGFLIVAPLPVFTVALASRLRGVAVSAAVADLLRRG